MKIFLNFVAMKLFFMNAIRQTLFTCQTYSNLATARRQLYLKMDDFVICANCFIVFFTFLPVLNLQYVYLHVFDWPGSRVSSTEYHTTWYAVRMTVKTSKNLSINSSIRLRIQWRVMNDSNLPEFFFIIHKQEKYHF